MTFISNNTNNKFTTPRTPSQIFDVLDSKDGRKDGKISADIWNTFSQNVGGKAITSHINKNDALKSINYYINNGKKGTIFNYFNDSSKHTSNNQPISKNNHSQATTQPKNLQQELTMGSDINFSKETIELNSKKYDHNTRLLDIAQEHLGLIEITDKEYQYLKKNDPAKLERTQYSMIGEHGQITDQWCAHTVSTLSERAGVDIGGHKKAVSEFINWAKSKNDFKPIITNWMDKSNIEKEKNSRAIQIKKQLPDMEEGDFIIWKAPYAANVGDKKLKNKHSSHIGIIESVNVETGTVIVIEGNANLFKKNEKGQLTVVKKQTDGKNGNQERGDFQEVNSRDGLIRKEYTIDELASMGYRGYIDNQKRLNPNTLAYN